MKVDLGIICRGIGESYVELLVSDIGDDHRVSISASTFKRNPIPLKQYDGSNRNDTQQRIICLIPYFENIDIELLVREIDSQGTSVAEWKKLLTPAHIRWASRYNYRLKKTQTQKIREACDRIDYRYVTVDSVFFSWNGSSFQEKDPEYILKVRVTTPLKDKDARVYLLDDFGNRREEQIIPFTQFHAIFPQELLGQKVYEFGFTIRIPFDQNTCCVVVEIEGTDLIGFLNIDSERRAFLIATRDLTNYKVGRNDNYARLLNNGVLGTQPASLVSSSVPDVGLLSIVVPLYKTPVPYLNEMIESVLNQVYTNWELVLVNASPEDDQLAAALACFDDPRIHVIELSSNEGIAENTNVGIEAAQGDYIFLLDHDDFIDPWTLFEYAKVINEDPSVDVIYCDEDFYDNELGFINPHFKSDFNIDLLRCHNYITHFVAMRSSLLKELLLNPAYDSAQDYDLLLRATEKTQAIKHIPYVLYHWRMHELSTSKNCDSKIEANEHGRQALQDHLKRCDINAQVYLTKIPFVYKVVYEVENEPLVSIIIPNKDNADVLTRCVDSIEQKSAYKNYEIIIVENNSVENETFQAYELLQEKYSAVKVVIWEHEFNYSKINNFGVKFAQGEYLLFLNNDTEVINPDWLESMVSLCQRPDVGIVGAKLLYPDDTVQHAGVVMTCCHEPTQVAGPIHIFASIDREDPGYFYRALLKQDLSAVTAACMMTKRSLFERLGGFDERFVVCYNDVDYCLRVRANNLLVVFDPEALLYHYESLTRGSGVPTTNVEDYSRFLAEQSLLRSLWPRYYAEGDPYHGKYSTICP